MKSRFSPAFALPTILISSVVMLIILLLAIQSTISVSEGIRGQYADKLGSEAAESGVALAKACIAQNGGTINWTNVKPLKPNTDCTGTESFSCPLASNNPACYLLDEGLYQSTFTVGVIYDSGNNPTDINAQGVVREVRKTSGATIREDRMSTKLKIGSSVTVVNGVSLASGPSHSCALDSDGKAYCWGNNDYGQLGNNSIGASNAPVAVAQGAIPAGVTLTSITTGDSFTCALGSNSKGYCWGANNYGQFGNNSTTNSSIPVAVAQGAIPAGVTLTSIAAGGRKTCAIGSDSKGYCWGNGQYGQLGNNLASDSYIPVAVAQGAIPAGVTLKSIAVGSIHACAIGSDDKGYCWGYNGQSQLGNNSTAQSNVPVAVAQGAIPAGVTLTSITTGERHTCAIGSDNKGYCWGYNNYSQLGNNSTTNSSIPVAVAQGAIPAGVTLNKISAGLMHTCAIGSDNKGYCWGYNGNGQLGISSYSNSSIPVAVAQGAIPAGVTLNKISAGYYHTCAIASNSKAYCWGNGPRIGDNTGTDALSPVPVYNISALPQGAPLLITAGFLRTCAIGSDYKGYCWGYNNNGQLGNNSTSTLYTPVAVAQGAIPAGVTLKSIAGGQGHTCAIGSNDKGYCWGYNGYGQMGSSSYSDSYTPVAVAQGAMPAGVTLKSITAGTYFTCAIGSDNKGYCWGYGYDGQTGNNLTGAFNTPVAVAQGAMPAGVTLKSITAGTNFTCAIGSDNKGYCWGYNGYGQLGNNSTAQSNVPVAVAQGAMPAGVTLKSVATGDRHTCAIGSDDKGYCWGYNGYGQLGNNSTVQSNVPVTVAQGAMPAGVTLKSITAGTNFTCAIGSDNKGYCWGYNVYNQLGNNSTSDSSTPTAVAQGTITAGATLTAITAGEQHTCAISSNNKGYCWGSNSYGAFGNNTTTSQATAVAILMGVNWATNGVSVTGSGNAVTFFTY